MVRRFRVTVDGHVFEVEVVELEEMKGEVGPSVAATSRPADLPAPTPAAVPEPPPSPRPVAAGSGTVTAPLPGVVLDVKVTPGQSVQAGQVVVILEAMKMENEIVAPLSGTVVAVDVTKGVSVGAGDRLVEIEA